MRTDQGYRPMTTADLAAYLADASDDETRWRLVAEFLEEYRHEPVTKRMALLADEPASTGDQRWDVLLAALAEHYTVSRETGELSVGLDFEIKASAEPGNQR